MNYFLLPLVLYCFVSFSAFSQETGDDDPASGLSRQEKAVLLHEPDAALTLSVGGTAQTRYHDNVYRSPAEKQGDFITIIAPGFRLNGDLKPYTFRLDGEVERGQYYSETNNDYTDGDLRWMLRHGRNAAAYYLDGRFRYDHTGIGAFADDPQSQSEEPATYRYMENGIGWTHDTPEWIGRIDARSFLYNYDNGRRVDGLPAINDDRDYAQHLLTARSGYKFWPQTALYLQTSLNMRHYDKRIDTTLSQTHDSSGHELLSGLVWSEPDNRWNGDISIGYLHQRYDDPGLEAVGVPALRAALEWMPSDTWKLRGEITRDIREAILADTSSYVQSRLRLRAEYFISPDWRTGGSLRLTGNDFQVTPVSSSPGRVDTVLDGGVFLDYLITEDYALGGEYLYVTRDSDDPAAAYDANVILLRLSVNY